MADLSGISYEHRVVMLTGAPGSGKTTLTDRLKTKARRLHVLRYGEIILDRLRLVHPNLSYENLRSESSSIVPSDLLKDVDSFVAEKAKELRETGHVIIESHAVTKEPYGFRVTPYHESTLRQLAFDAFVFLNCSAGNLMRRNQPKLSGRLEATMEEHSTHNDVQRNVALLYSLITGRPLYILDAGQNQVRVARLLERVLASIGVTLE
jgi:adenylate kinase